MSYFIKYINGPHGQKGYPYGGKLHFARGQEDAMKRFMHCSGLLLYETGASENGVAGAKAIYAFGEVDRQKGYELDRTNPIYPYVVYVILHKRISPLSGVSLSQIRNILGMDTRENMQRPGGLLSISEKNYQALVQLILN